MDLAVGPGAPARVNKAPRNRMFDLMRLVFAVLVLLSHAPEIQDGNRSHELLSRFTHGAMSFGDLGVDGFFLLSGFLITQSWQRDPRLGDYLGKRVLRIVPGYLVAVAISIVVVGLLAPATPHFFHLPGRKALQSVLLLSAPITRAVFPGYPQPSVNGALWTIAYEFRCYLLLALAGLAGVLRQRWVVAGAALSLLLLSNVSRLAAHVSWHAYNVALGEPGPTFRMVGFFAVGVCYYLCRDRIRFHPAGLAVTAAGLVAVHLLAIQSTEASVFLFGSYALFYLAQHGFGALDRMGRLPDISYGVYLYGWPVEHLWCFYSRTSPWIVFAGSTLICLVLGWLSWHFVERPMLRWKPRPTAELPPG